MERIPGTKRQPAGPKVKPDCRKFYSTYQWQKISGLVLKDEPVCRLCGRVDRPSVDHIDGNNKNNLRYNLQNLCLTCHGWKSNVFDKSTKLAEITDLLRFHASIPEGGIPFLPCRPYLCDTQYLCDFYSGLVVAIHNPDYFFNWHSSAVNTIEYIRPGLNAERWVYTKPVYNPDLIRLDCEGDLIPYPVILQYTLLRIHYYHWVNQ